MIIKSHKDLIKAAQKPIHFNKHQYIDMFGGFACEETVIRKTWVTIDRTIKALADYDPKFSFLRSDRNILLGTNTKERVTCVMCLRNLGLKLEELEFAGFDQDLFQRIPEW